MNTVEPSINRARNSVGGDKFTNFRRLDGNARTHAAKSGKTFNKNSGIVSNDRRSGGIGWGGGRKGEEIEWNLRYRKSSRSIIRSTPFLTGRGPIDLILSVFHRVGPHL